MRDPVAPAPDSVTEGKAYQRFVLGWLREDDPVEAQTSTLTSLPALVAEAGFDLTVEPEPGEWSVLECVGHIADAELVTTARYRWILAHERPPLIGYDQDLWATLDYHAEGPDLIVERFLALRRSNLDLWSRSTPEQRQRIGLHAERGEESFDLLFRMIAGHDRVHLDQGRRALEAVRAREGVAGS